MAVPTLLPALHISGAGIIYPPVQITLTDNSISTAFQSSYTFSSQSLGAEDDGRYIIVAFGSQESTATAVTVAGVSATKLVDAPDAGAADENASLWIAAVPTGTTGDIVVTLDSNSTCCGIGVWRKTGGDAIASHLYAVDDESGTPSEDLNIPADGGAICYGFQRTNTTTTRGTVTGLTEDFDEEVEAANSVHIGGSGTFDEAQSALTTTISFGASGVRAAHFVAATFGPEPGYSVDFLVIAGGGSGGSSSNGGGGGGAGGFRASYNSETSGGGGSSESALSFSKGTVYTITVGAGGSSAYQSVGDTGSDSSISGSNITTITSNGGGAGGTSNDAGAGGSGGGGDGSSTFGGSGTANQGYDGAYGFNGGYGGHGGGGAGQVGQNVTGSGSSAVGGDGGDGQTSTITGSSVIYAGGGGGGDWGTGGTGGTGGGGDGTDNSGTAVSGTTNTGGGGGGSGGFTSTSGAGGSGVVILRMATADYSGTTTGSPTVTTDGSDTILKFTSSGTYTA